MQKIYFTDSRDDAADFMHPYFYMVLLVLCNLYHVISLATCHIIIPAVNIFL